ncbi:Hypothetical predicted protein [Pelobates cultripes]|uniref:Uncharacterized protein n=1 Tax=Pelobates cultripes TaxID=61616 RepID=A0AAD1RFN8_PELCU|nr:Hypothetical predicted protein [Pelobates cultripes]
MCTKKPTACCTGPLDDFVSMPAGDSQPEIGSDDTLHSIQTVLAKIAGNMLTKADTSVLVQEIQMAVREDLLALRTDLMALEARVDAIKGETRLCCQQHCAAETAATRQGNMLLSII